MAKNEVRTLPSNILTILAALAMDNLATAASIAHERAILAPRGSRSRAFWAARELAIINHAFGRGWSLYRMPDDDLRRQYLYCPIGQMPAQAIYERRQAMDRAS